MADKQHVIVTVDKKQYAKCGKCAEVKPLSDFPMLHGIPKLGDCKSCKNAKQAKWRSEHPEYVAAQNAKTVEWCKRNRAYVKDKKSRQHLMATYGITPEWVNGQRDRQMGICDICGVDLCETNTVSTHVDHDHITGKVRGVLCQACNKGLGYFRDRTDYLESAIIYLRKNHGSQAS